MKTTHPQRQPPDLRGRFAVHSTEGRVGVLKAVISGPRLLLVDAPQVAGGLLLIPFDAIEHIKVDERTVLLRPTWKAVEPAVEGSEGPRDGG